MPMWRPMKQSLAGDRFWLLVWILGLAGMMAWDSAYLNAPAFAQVQESFVHSMLAGLLVVILSLCLGWAAALLLYYGEDRRAGWVRVVRFLLDLIRSMPQIIGLLTGYVQLIIFLERGIITTQYGQIVWTSFVVSVFLFIEVVDVITERIRHYAASDFVPAMLGCGIGEWRIVNLEILWRNCRAHLLNKAVSVFGMAIFLQCSVDFVVSVGLSTDVSLTNVPMTLGSLLAKIDSKQDILAMGIIFSDPSYVPNLFIRHLQGTSTAFFIIFTLLCVARISEGLARRYRL
jgi:hypothetical protein